MRFSAEIEAALANGAVVEDMTLRLTLGDATKLARDPSIPVEDIAYVDGVMRFMGVTVERGGVESSTLEWSDPAG
ncbi:hypothetical protein [Phenylobacterium sp.]|uniref:hypothetical protein n=1 Tax=Phenylobacterium sp. TaxID=1871053 RepID=UPI0025ED6B77|nr:hypothetical protein [Phenylobacterium sp.]